MQKRENLKRKSENIRSQGIRGWCIIDCCYPTTTVGWYNCCNKPSLQYGDRNYCG